MNEDGRRRGLGRGLSALLGEDAAATTPSAGGVKSLPIHLLHPGRLQPRRHFDEEGLAALADSIAAQGVLQPLLARPSRTMLDGYEILAGERRWRAAARAKLREVPVLVRDMDDRDALEIALVENIQREDLGPLDEASGYQRLIAEFGHTQEELARRVGKSRSHIANMMRLLNLPDPVKAMLEDGALSAGHGRALLGAADPAALAREVARKGLSVRETERAAQASQRPASAEPAKRARPDPNVTALAHDLSQALGLTVSIHPEGEGGGRLSIHYRALDQLDEVVRRLLGGAKPG